MKKLSVLLAVIVISTSVAPAQDWAFGARLGSGFQGVAQRHFHNDNYVEMRLGMNWVYYSIMADVSALYVWNLANMDWTDEGRWFFDAGAGVNLGGRSRYLFAGVQGVAKLGYEFEDAPVSISFDWSPAFGPGLAYWPGGFDPILGVGFPGGSRTGFNEDGLANFGISCVFKF